MDAFGFEHLRAAHVVFEEAVSAIDDRVTG
jgi:hypothetical protein